ncbi:MAG: endonuclease III [Bdellovibrionales bacterium]|nr:endonuclease III [Bdellovibrionales bacterium]
MSKEALKTKKQRVKKVVHLLKRYHPKADCALYHKNPVQLLVATVLSAQCTDKRVNQVTKTLFKKYPTAKAFASANLRELEQEIHSTGFFRSKAQNIKAACQKIQKEFKGKVPSCLEDLLTLPGVGRKTAHVILGTAFQISSGVVVDTHVRRLSNRLHFTNSKDPEKIEKDLNYLLPKKEWIYFSHALILHGREVCKARAPRCNTCFLEEFCPKKGVEKRYMGSV